MRDYLYFTSLLNPVDVATMVALGAVMLVLNRQEETSLRQAFTLMLAVGVPIAMWTAFSRGMQWPPFVRHTGLFVICGVTLLYEGLRFFAAAAGALVLVVANVGCTALMK